MPRKPVAVDDLPQAAAAASMRPRPDAAETPDMAATEFLDGWLQ